jgi:predicted RNase H-like nuclease
MGSGGERVLGVDACKRGWIGIAIQEGVAGAYFAEHIEALITQAQADGPIAVVAVDMPIGLPDTGRRQADVLAREVVGPLWPSVFITPSAERCRPLTTPPHRPSTARSPGTGSPSRLSG